MHGLTMKIQNKFRTDPLIVLRSDWTVQSWVNRYPLTISTFQPNSNLNLYRNMIVSPIYDSLPIAEKVKVEKTDGY